MAIADSEPNTSGYASPALSHRSTQEISEILPVENNYQEHSAVSGGSRPEKLEHVLQSETHGEIC